MLTRRGITSAALTVALLVVPLAAGPASAAPTKAPWKNLPDRQSHAIAVDIGLVPSAASPQNCTDTLQLRSDKRIALTWISTWGLKPEREGACGDRQPLPGADMTYTSGFLALRGADGTWSPIVDMADPDCYSMEKALADADVDIDSIMAAISQVVRLSPLKKCKLTIVDDQTPWREGSTKKMRAVANDVGAAPREDFPSRCYSLSLLRVDPRVAILTKTRWGAKPEQYGDCGNWEPYVRPIAIWNGNQWVKVDDTYSGDCSGIRSTLRSYGVPESGIDEVISRTLGGSTNSCS